MKKVIAMLLSLALVLSLTVAFAGEREDLLAEHISLKIMTRENYYAGKSFTEDLEVFQAFAEDQNVTLEWEVVASSQYGEVLRTRLAAAVDLPDCINCSPIQPASYGASGIVIPLENMINEVITPNYVAFLADHPVMEALQLSPDGHQYQFSGYCGAGEMIGGGYGLTLRGDWLERLGLDVPTTTDELYEVLKAFKEQDANGNGDPDDEIPFSDGYGSLNVLAISFGCGYRMGDFDVDPDGNLYFCCSSEQYRDFLRYVNKLYNEQLIDPEFATTDDDQVEAKEAQNIIGGRFMLWVDEIPFSEQMIQSADPEGYYVMLNPLTGPNGTKGVIYSSGMLDGRMCVSRDSKYPERALSFLDYMIFNDYATICNNCGAEDICWNYADDGSVAFTEFVTNNPEDLSPMEAIRSTGGYHTMPFVMFAEGRKLMNSVNDRIVGYIDSMAPYVVDRLEYSPSTETEATRISELNRDISVLVSEMRLLFMTGEADIETDWDGYLETLDSLGLAEYTALYQAKYDRVYK